MDGDTGKVLGFKQLPPTDKWNWNEQDWEALAKDPKTESLALKPAEETKPVTTRTHYPIGF